MNNLGILIAKLAKSPKDESESKKETAREKANPKLELAEKAPRSKKNPFAKKFGGK